MYSASRWAGWLIGALILAGVFGFIRTAQSGGVDPQQIEQRAQDAADRVSQSLTDRAVQVVQDNPDAFLVCLAGLVATLMFGQYRKPFANTGTKIGLAEFRLQCAIFGTAATGLMLWAFFHYASDERAGAELVAGLVLAAGTGFGAPLAYDLVLWRLVDRFIATRPPPSDGGGTP